MTNSKILEEISIAFEDFNDSLVENLVNEAIELGIAPIELLNHLSGILETMGDQYSKGEIFLPELMVAGDMMEVITEILKTEMLKNKEAIPKIGTILLGTVKNDVHCIGKNIVKMMFTASGFEVVDLGTDVSPEKFAQEAQRIKPELIGLSTCMSATLPFAEETVKYLEALGIRDKVKVLIGGGSVTKSIAEKYGADGFGEDGAIAVKVAKNLIGNL